MVEPPSKPNKGIAPPNEGTAPHERDTARLESFSDAVYGFAITLLALDLHVPRFEHGGGDQGGGDHGAGELAAGAPTAGWLASALAANWPTYLTFVASFVTVIIMWSHHRALCSLVSRATLRLQFANGLLLVFTTTVAFPTAVVAEYIDTPAARTAAMLYVGQQVLLATAFLILLHVATGADARSPDASEATIRALKRSYAIGPPLYLVTLVAAWFVPQIAIAVSVALWIFWAFVPSYVSSKEARAPA